MATKAKTALVTKQTAADIEAANVKLAYDRLTADQLRHLYGDGADWFVQEVRDGVFANVIGATMATDKSNGDYFAYMAIAQAWRKGYDWRFKRPAGLTRPQDYDVRAADPAEVATVKLSDASQAAFERRMKAAFNAGLLSGLSKPKSQSDDAVKKAAQREAAKPTGTAAEHRAKHAAAIKLASKLEATAKREKDATKRAALTLQVSETYAAAKKALDDAAKLEADAIRAARSAADKALTAKRDAIRKAVNAMLDKADAAKLNKIEAGILRLAVSLGKKQAAKA